ncbi:hypothetical protein FH972_001012 [Carpinus fangiana]|uniref:Thioredoxin domain-containing protein n=1 Tax=Carpinus fangiana TaxID=176857 RepID=A0A5N6QAF5_9ROSI|nr:hypothetical protein FH972_001012 [Carpinus fangiana]
MIDDYFGVPREEEKAENENEKKTACLDPVLEKVASTSNDDLQMISAGVTRRETEELQESRTESMSEVNVNQLKKESEPNLIDDYQTKYCGVAQQDPNDHFLEKVVSTLNDLQMISNPSVSSEQNPAGAKPPSCWERTLWIPPNPETGSFAGVREIGERDTWAREGEGVREGAFQREKGGYACRVVVERKKKDTRGSSMVRRVRKRTLKGDQVIGICSFSELEMQLNAASTTCRLAILYFHKARPCRFISPFYASLARKYRKVVFLKVDIEEAEAQDVTTAWKIRRAPYFFFLKNGKLVDKVVGIDEDELERKVKLHSRKQARST